MDAFADYVRRRRQTRCGSVVSFVDLISVGTQVNMYAARLVRTHRTLTYQTFVGALPQFETEFFLPVVGLPSPSTQSPFHTF